MKWGPKKASLTTAQLQLSEACALVESLPKWTVVEKVRSDCQTCTFAIKAVDPEFVNNFFFLRKLNKTADKDISIHRDILYVCVGHKFVKITHYTIN